MKPHRKNMCQWSAIKHVYRQPKNNNSDNLRKTPEHCNSAMYRFAIVFVVFCNLFSLLTIFPDHCFSCLVLVSDFEFLCSACSPMLRFTRDFWFPLSTCITLKTNRIHPPSNWISLFSLVTFKVCSFFVVFQSGLLNFSMIYFPFSHFSQSHSVFCGENGGPVCRPHPLRFHWNIA